MNYDNYITFPKFLHILHTKEDETPSCFFFKFSFTVICVLSKPHRINLNFLVTIIIRITLSLFQWVECPYKITENNFLMVLLVSAQDRCLYLFYFKGKRDIVVKLHYTKVAFLMIYRQPNREQKQAFGKRCTFSGKDSFLILLPPHWPYTIGPLPSSFQPNKSSDHLNTCVFQNLTQSPTLAWGGFLDSNNNSLIFLWNILCGECLPGWWIWCGKSEF